MDNKSKDNPDNKFAAQDSKLKLLNFDLADIYFPMYVIQIHWDVFPLRNKKYKTNQNQQMAALSYEQNGREDEDLAIMNHEMMREQYEQ